eukprot:scaffold3594_cov133-Isochrysis_galbana.AAC.3
MALWGLRKTRKRKNTPELGLDEPPCGSMIVPWGAVGPTTAVGVYKPPHAPERGMGRPPHVIPLRQ